LIHAGEGGVDFIEQFRERGTGQRRDEHGLETSLAALEFRA
jgi:hypothetical protein